MGVELLAVERALLLLAGDVERNPGPKKKSSFSGFSVMSWNMRGWKARTKGDLQRLLRTKRPAVLMLQETLLPAGDPVDLENGRFEGYAFIGKPRTTPVRADKEVRGGGLAVLVRQDLTGFETAFDAGLDRVTEYLQVEVSWQGQTFKLLNIYRPPCEQTRDKTSTDRVTAMAPESWPRDLDVVGGDLNLRHPAWDATCGVPLRIRVDHRPPSDCMRELAEDVLEETVGRRDTLPRFWL